MKFVENRQTQDVVFGGYFETLDIDKTSSLIYNTVTVRFETSHIDDYYSRRKFFMYQVVKRDGSTVDFDISKIAAAMVKAFDLSRYIAILAPFVDIL